MKAQLYSAPVESVNKAAQLLEQLKNTTGKTGEVAGLKSLLVKAAQLLAPGYFDITTLPGGDDKPTTDDPGQCISGGSLCICNCAVEFRLKDLAKKAQIYSHCKQSVVKHSECIGREKEEER